MTTLAHDRDQRDLLAEIAQLREEVASVLVLAHGALQAVDATLAKVAPAPAKAGKKPPLDLRGRMVPEMVNAIMATGGHKPALTRTVLQQALEARDGVRTAGGGKDKIARPPRGAARRAGNDAGGANGRGNGHAPVIVDLNR